VHLESAAVEALKLKLKLPLQAQEMTCGQILWDLLESFSQLFTLLTLNAPRPTSYIRYHVDRLRQLCLVVCSVMEPDADEPKSNASRAGSAWGSMMIEPNKI
jgi:hypothetical protein